MRWMLGLVWLAACGGSHGLDGGELDGGEIDGGGIDGGGIDAPASGCVERPIVSGAPAAYLFSGSAPSVDYSGRPAGTIEESLVVYFPEGTSEGSRAIAVHPISWPFAGLTTSEATVTDGRVSVEVSGSHARQDFSVRGTLDLSRGVVVATATRNFALPWTDVAEPGMGPIELCHVGADTTGASLAWVSPATTSTISALTPLRVSASVPLDDGARLHLEQSGSDVPAEVTPFMGVIELRPTGAWPMGSALTLLLEGTDVLGRTPSLPGAITIARPTAVLTDLSLDTPPPDGAVVGEWRDGALRVEVEGFAPPVPYLVDELTAALGEPPPSASFVRITALRSLRGGEVRAAVIDERGAASELDLDATLSLDPIEHVVPIPGPGPLHLVLAIHVLPTRPQWYSGAARGGVDVTEITFE